MKNKLEEIAEKAYMDMITSKGSEQDEEITGEFKSEEDIDKFFLEKYNV